MDELAEKLVNAGKAIYTNKEDVKDASNKIPKHNFKWHQKFLGNTLRYAVHLYEIAFIGIRKKRIEMFEKV